MKKQLCILFFTLFALSANGQQVPTTKLTTDKPPTLQELQADPNVLWIGEAMVDYAPDYHTITARDEIREKMTKIGFSSINYVKTLKLQSQDIDDDDKEEHKLATILLGSIDDVTCYADAALTKSYTKEEARSKITKNYVINTIDPETSEEVTFNMSHKINPSAIHSFRMKQLIYYDKKRVTFQVIPLAIAPLIDESGTDGTITMKPLFWCKLDFFDAMPNLNSAAISYAKRMYRPLPQEAITPLKGTQTLGDLTMMMVEDIKKSKGEKYLGNVFNMNGSDPLPISEIEEFSNTVDTIITFDPNTFDEIVQVVRINMTAEGMTKMRLIQDWIWNDETKTMGIHFVGFAPIIDRLDNEGNFWNSGPLFYRRPDLDKPTLK